MGSEINSITNILRIVHVFSVKGCSEMEGSSGPALKGLRNGTLVVGKVGQEKSTFFNGTIRRKSFTTRDVLV